MKIHIELYHTLSDNFQLIGKYVHQQKRNNQIAFQIDYFESFI